MESFFLFFENHFPLLVPKLFLLDKTKSLSTRRNPHSCTETAQRWLSCYTEKISSRRWKCNEKKIYIYILKIIRFFFSLFSTEQIQRRKTSVDSSGHENVSSKRKETIYVRNERSIFIYLMKRIFPGEFSSNHTQVLSVCVQQDWRFKHFPTIPANKILFFGLSAVSKLFFFFFWK